ncbi:hypothetical protein [Acuticoccus mangrovi]|uniref:Uncharacterized protein n=1 Tax=Acuticoccus mangrovi TaxID=2796142 RepID=A0A934IMT4_9HYPH|nr:hypothetical protein [Acuticoccus mangrovi]MBJ3777796.1 hypothetical protein [Acuticoccus mangrovi]
MRSMTGPIAAVAIALTALPASATTWTKPDASAADIKAAVAQCQADAKIAAMPADARPPDHENSAWLQEVIDAGAAHGFTEDELVTSCMKANGFYDD